MEPTTTAGPYALGSAVGLCCIQGDTYGVKVIHADHHPPRLITTHPPTRSDAFASAYGQCVVWLAGSVNYAKQYNHHHNLLHVTRSTASE